VTDAGNAFRAGLVIVAGSIIAIVFFFASKKTSLDERNSLSYYAYLTDASGVNAKSLITIAGLQVGEIKNISLRSMRLDEYIPDFEIRALALLGFPPPSPDIRIVQNEDFDSVIAGLIREDKLPSRDEVYEQKIPKETVLDAIKLARSSPIRVARVDFAVNAAEQIPIDTWMKKESLGVLGAKALFLELGSSPAMLKEGERLINVRSMTATDALLAQAGGIVADVKSITKKLDNDIGGITHDIKGITGELNRFVAGDENSKPLNEIYRLVMNDLRRLSNTVESAVRDANRLFKDKDSDFSMLIANVERITRDIAEMTSAGTPATAVQGGDGGALPGPPGAAEQQGDIRATMASVRKMADDLSSVTSQLKSMLGENEEDVAEGVRSLKVTIDELNRSLRSLSEVAGRVERGEGTVGRLLTDERIADKVESAVAGAADLVASITSLETHVDIGTWYNVQRAANTTIVGLRLQPKPDKYYLVEVVDDGGRLERFTERNQDGEVIRESIREEDNQIRITAMYAKKFFDFLVLRVGLIETTGGVGANLFFLDDRIELRSDLFDFRGPRDTLQTDALPSFYLPRWRTVLKAQPIPHLYVSAGVDDVLNSVGPGGLQLYTRQLGYGFDYFFGVGLTFKDDDLRAILPFIPGG
jgi:phospholipid/cholesterol/gamma-HCH transport system substrate-binding protein